MKELTTKLKDYLLLELQTDETELWKPEVQCINVVKNSNLCSIDDKGLVRSIEKIVRCWDKNESNFSREDNRSLFGYLDELCSSRGITFDRIGLGNGMMSATAYKFIKDNTLIFDFAIWERY